MRLKPFDQVVLVLLILAVICAAVFVGLVCWLPGGDALLDNLTATVKFLLTSEGTTVAIINKILCTIGALLVLFFCLRILFVRKKRVGRPTPDVVHEGIMLRNGEHGTSYITIKAIDAMVKKHVRANQKVRDCKVAIQPTDDQQNLNLQLQLVLAPDVVIPETCGELQASLSNHIQEMTGVVVKEVRVTVDDNTELPSAAKTRTIK